MRLCFGLDMICTCRWTDIPQGVDLRIGVVMHHHLDWGPPLNTLCFRTVVSNTEKLVALVDECVITKLDVSFGLVDVGKSLKTAGFLI